MRKYSEDEILKEISEYVDKTYGAHYSVGSVQTLDLIESVGDAEAFCRSNILKYASRYDKKIIHYGMLLLHFNDKHDGNHQTHN